MSDNNFVENSSESLPFLKSNNDNMSDEDIQMLEDYDQEYHQLSAKISRAISSMNGASGSKLDSVVRDIKKDLKTCERCVSKKKIYYYYKILSNLYKK